MSKSEVMPKRPLTMPFDGVTERDWKRDDPWGAIRYVASFPEDPPPLSRDHKEWLTGLQGKLWQETSPDRFGQRATVENRVSLDPEDVVKLFRLVREHKLMTTLHQATFGFTGFTLAVHEFQHETYPGVGCDSEFLMSMSDDHLPGYPKHEDRDDRLQLAWELFSAFTHAEGNLWMVRRVERHKVNTPGPRDRYVY